MTFGFHFQLAMEAKSRKPPVFEGIPSRYSANRTAQPPLARPPPKSTASTTSQANTNGVYLQTPSLDSVPPNLFNQVGFGAVAMDYPTRPTNILPQQAVTQPAHITNGHVLPPKEPTVKLPISSTNVALPNIASPSQHSPQRKPSGEKAIIVVPGAVNSAPKSSLPQSAINSAPKSSSPQSAINSAPKSSSPQYQAAFPAASPQYPTAVPTHKPAVITKGKDPVMLAFETSSEYPEVAPLTVETIDSPMPVQQYSNEDLPQLGGFVLEATPNSQNQKSSSGFVFDATPYSQTQKPFNQFDTKATPYSQTQKSSNGFQSTPSSQTQKSSNEFVEINTNSAAQFSLFGLLTPATSSAHPVILPHRDREVEEHDFDDLIYSATTTAAVRISPATFSFGVKDTEMQSSNGARPRTGSVVPTRITSEEKKVNFDPKKINGNHFAAAPVILTVQNSSPKVTLVFDL
jgi:hypothetical protein